MGARKKMDEVESGVKRYYPPPKEGFACHAYPESPYLPVQGICKLCRATCNEWWLLEEVSSPTDKQLGNLCLLTGAEHHEL